MPCFPMRSPLGRGEDPQWLYTVVFDARQLWGRTPIRRSSLDRSLRAYIEPAELKFDPVAAAPRDEAVPGIPHDGAGEIPRALGSAGVRMVLALQSAVCSRGANGRRRWVTRSSGRKPAVPGSSDNRTALACGAEAVVAEKGVASEETPGATRSLGPRRRSHAARHADRARADDFA